MNNEQAGLIAACIDGDEAAISKLIQEHQLGVFRLCLSVLGDPAEANEAAQDTFVAALGALKTYQETANFKAWLYTIALNQSRTRLRKRKSRERLQNALAALFHFQVQRRATPEESIIVNEEETALWEALAELGEKHRLPIILRYYHDLSVREIAELLNIKEGTVHSRLSIARERLRSALERRNRATGESFND